jgi:hypothetical protein
VLRTAQLIIDEGLAIPVLVGRADVIAGCGRERIVK